MSTLSSIMYQISISSVAVLGRQGLSCIIDIKADLIFTASWTTKQNIIMRLDSFFGCVRVHTGMILHKVISDRKFNSTNP